MSFALCPETKEIMDFHWGALDEYKRASDELGLHQYSRQCLNDLTRLLSDKNASRLVLESTRFYAFADHLAYERRHWKLASNLQKRGVTRSVGKRARPGVVEFVECIAPMLIHFGLLARTGEGSVLVNALRIIAEEFSIAGDPRNELRRHSKAQKDEAELARNIARGAMLNFLPPPTTPEEK